MISPPLPFPEIAPVGIEPVISFKKFQRVVHRIHCAVLYDDRARMVMMALSRGPALIGTQMYRNGKPTGFIYANSVD